ncbi:MAG TPA: hydratase, partial [Bauldia sp.]|nr:hydratase [Bauldia sp.]
MDGAMAPERIEEAAAILLANWRNDTRIAALPEACRPRGRSEGYRVAAALARLSGDTVAGWKIAATSAAGQKHINVDGPLAGRILAGRLVPPGGTVRLGANVMKVAEAEFAFVMGRDLPPTDRDFTPGEVMAAVSGLRLSIEVPDSRYT